jgi:hypothetical protein
MVDTASISLVGGADLTAGTHACLTFTDAEERLDLVAGFVRDGLRRQDKVICWSDELAPDAMVKELAARSVRPGAAIRRGQLTVQNAGESPLVRAGTGAEMMVSLLSDEMARAESEGYDSLRVTIDMGCITRPTAAADQLAGFESSVAGLFAGGRLCLVCQYDRDRFDAVTLAFAADKHPATMAAQVYYQSALLRICRQYSPAGLRVAGELDYRHVDVFEQALGEAVRLDRHPQVNLSGLAYIDAAAASVIVRCAGRLSTSRRMTVTCGRLVGTMLETIGAHRVPQLRMQRAYAES